MRQDRLSSRERVRLALEHRETDRIPIAMVCSGINQPARDEFDSLLRKTRGVNAATFLRELLDIRNVMPPYTGPALPAGTDKWGVVRQAVSYGLSSYQEISVHPLANMETETELNAYPFPRVEDHDYAALPDLVRAAQADGEHCLLLSGGNPFESSWYMRGFERVFMDMIERPEFVHALMRKVTDFFLGYLRHALAAANGQVDLVFTADDIGGQNGLLVSPAMWAEFIKPYHAELNEVVHSFGAKVIYHSDGAVADAVPGLLDMGIDVLQALQFDAAGMDPARLKNEFGDRLCFEGGVSVQSTLPFGSVADVCGEVRRHIAVLGRNGGYILGPSHAIQAGTPAKNILAMFDTAVHGAPLDS
jgi:uroporphyrinogen decarboxylase